MSCLAFLSVVGCRIIPQVVGPLDIEEGRVSWSPVFEFICGFDGSVEFFLHGRDGEGTCIYPGSVTGIEKICNELLFEVEPLRSETKKEEVPFSKLEFDDRSKLLDVVTSHVVLHVVEPLNGKLFPCSNDDDEAMLLERRTMLLKMHKFGERWKNMNLEEEQLCYNPSQVDITEKCSEMIHSDGQSFLSSSDTFGISLKASYTKMSSYEGWPNMPEERFALYKLLVQNPLDDELYAGVWGGTFGWPIGKCNEGKPEKPLYLLMLTYKESEENIDERVLIGTKILEGTHYVEQPNGSAMFVANIDTPSSFEDFPFDADGKNFEHSYTGQGISDGYGFRNTGSKPGSLFVFSNDHIAFVWKETKDVLTLQRLNLEEVLKKGLGLYISPLHPTKIFMYIVRSYVNEFTNSSNYSSSYE